MLTLTRIAVLALSVWLGFTIYASIVLFRYQYQRQQRQSNHENPVGDYGSHDDNGKNRPRPKTELLLIHLNQALSDVKRLSDQNEQLKNLLNEKLDKFLLASQNNRTTWADNPMNSKQLAPDRDRTPLTRFVDCRSSPKFGHLSLAHESRRRTLENGVREFWMMLGNKLNRIKSLPANTNNLSQNIDRLRNRLFDQYLTVYAQSLLLAESDGAVSNSQSELAELSHVIQRRLHTLQHPPDCNKARRLLCTLNKGCGFGCQVHHAVYCFISAYATNRTFILTSDNWRYSNDGWESVFRPLSETCTEKTSSLRNVASWEGYNKQKNVDVISLPIIDGLFPRLEQLPLAFPKEFAQNLLRLHGNPAVWWIGQFLKYLWRYQPELSKKIDNLTKALNFTKPLVGVHVRRTDKIGTEASFHSVDEYMQHVEEWFKLQDTKNRLMTSSSSSEMTSSSMADALRTSKTSPVPLKRRIYLATDDPGVIDDARKKYPHYEIIADKNIAATAGMNNRFSDNSLVGVILDIHFLAETDFLVCTFSSQVCRLAYELMQIRRGDDSAQRFKSLDDIFYFGGQDDHQQVAVLDHHVTKDQAADQSGEIELRVGDVISVFGNHWDGYSKGKNHRTGQTGLYPSYKVKEAWLVRDFPAW